MSNFYAYEPWITLDYWRIWFYVLEEEDEPRHLPGAVDEAVGLAAAGPGLQ